MTRFSTGARGPSGPLRVLHVTASDQLRGAELFAADLVRALGGAGVEQHVAIVRPSEGPSVQFDAPMTVIGTDGRKIPGLRVGRAQISSLRGVIRGWQPDIVQSHGGETLKYSTFAGARQTAPIVYRRIGGAPPWIRRGPRRMAYAALMRRAARVVAVSEALRQETIELFRIRDVITIPNAVDARRMRTEQSREDMRRTLGISPSAPVVLSLGALTWEKDPVAHLEVGARVMAAVPGAIHLVVGDGPLRPQIEGMARSRKLDGRFRLLGQRSDVPDLLSASDVLLFASRLEGMPATLIEAGMMGVPVVAYGIAGVPEVVEDGVTGFLAPQGRVDDLSEHVVTLLRATDQRRALGSAARRRCRSQFDISAIAPRYLEVYEELRKTA